jgi:hypothetical protein
MNITAARLLEAMHSKKTVSGLTHDFYKYPARFPPRLANEVISNFSSSNDWIFDPFMGGGTAIVEALAIGRRAAGVDINPLACFVTRVKTTPLSPHDLKVISEWAISLSHSQGEAQGCHPAVPALRHLPRPARVFAARARDSISGLDPARQRAFARCVLLRTLQKIVETPTAQIGISDLKKRLSDQTTRMVSGMADLISAYAALGFRAEEVASRRVIVHGSALDLDVSRRLAELRGRVPVVFTSPPYPRVHILYHRWQVRGRKESSLPYWICGLTDSRTASYYTMGSRTPWGQQVYFRSLTTAGEAVRSTLARDGLLVQLVGFSEMESQLPLYLESMRLAGYREVFPVTRRGQRLWREVPNRKWYAKDRQSTHSSLEVLLFHERSR